MPQPMDWGLSAPYLLAALLGGYLLGAIPFGLILTRLAGLGDIRTIGSGNIGATNVLRTGNRYLAALTLLLDGGKGAAAVLIAKNFGADVTVCAAAGAFFGHLFPVWLRFRGGKGVATFLGIALALNPLAGALSCATWAAVAALFRISSAAALAAAATSPLYFWLLGQDQLMQLSLLLAVAIWLKHYDNIRRLMAGEEPRIGASSPE
ncbi:MAG: acyl phosphate:glycerol-3-phosphate acyltransferase [Alphaproteobacteria bacterium]|nr:acyl phosphate:glycerol-3-phosphate acyltransferase [Alphaproteobacteria bacterium]